MLDQAVIQREIDRLKTLRPLIPAKTFFGDSNLEVIDAEIKVLSERMSRTRIDRAFDPEMDPEGRIMDAMLASYDWMMGKEEDAPSKEWEPLAKTSLPGDDEEQNETEDGYYCDSCERGWQLGDEDECPPLYQCGSCGTTFTRDNSADGDSNRCPDCNKFAAKECEHSCPDCETEVMEGKVVQKDGEWKKAEEQ